MDIKINGENYTWPLKTVKYEDLVDICNQRQPTVTYTIRGSVDGHRLSGTLTLGQEVLVVREMEFNVITTGSA